MGNTFNFSDIFKKSFLNTAVQELTLGRLLLTMGVSFVIGVFVYLVYKRTFRGVLYSSAFNLSLIAITMITSFVIMAVTSNVVLSLGMVGALSIVRFRTAIKDPMDLVFLFWTITVGIVSGAGLHLFAILGSVIIGLVVFLLSRAPLGDPPYLLVVQASGHEADEGVRSLLGRIRQQYNVKSKTIADSGIETTYEVRVKDGGTALIRDISGIKGVASAILISYNGDYVS